LRWLTAAAAGDGRRSAHAFRYRYSLEKALQQAEADPGLLQ
jgi:hypothetical protein